MFSSVTSLRDLTDRQRARALRGLGQSLIARQRRAEAAEPLAGALAAAISSGDRFEMGWARQWIGVLHYGDGRADQARAIWMLALDDFRAAGDGRGEFEVLDDLAIITPGLDGRELHERAYAIAVAERNPLLEARARFRWGQFCLFAGHAGAALIELEQAVAILDRLSPGVEDYLADTLATLGWALRAHGAYDRAVPVQRRALAIARANHDYAGQAWNYLGLGVALAALGRIADAHTAMINGLEAARRTRTPTTIRLLTESAGWVALERGRPAEAAALIESSIAMPGTDPAVLPHIDLATAYRRMGRLDDALRTANRACELAREHSLVDGEVRALIERAQDLEALGDLDGAERDLDEVIDRVEKFRAELAPSDFLKQGFGERFGDAYGASVNLLATQGRGAEALATAERARSRAFADLLVARRAADAEAAADAGGGWRLGKTTPGVGSSSARSDSPIAVRALDQAGLVALARRLSTTLVVYWIHLYGSHVWVVAPTGEIHTAVLRTSPAGLERAVRLAVDTEPELAIARPRAGHATGAVAGRQAYRALYRLLWAPITRWLPAEADARITVVPHGPLFRLPFAALIDDRGHYLVERYSLHYAASGAVLASAAEHVHAASSPKDRVLLVADPWPAPRSESGELLPALKAARAEVRSIAPLFGASVDLLVGAQASEQAVRAALPSASVAHFATHALVRDTDPLGSHLVLAAPGSATPKTEEDGRLTASEVADLSLASDLVVLGACRSARGPVSSDGIAGLTRAFMTAGAPSVVATLWEVPDAPMARLMVAFYAAYLSGVNKDRALRAAQMRLLADLRAGRVRRTVGHTVVTYPEHPWFWAAPILVGAP